MNNKIKNICISGIGIALFVTCSMCLSIPVFENYYLCTGYIVLAFFANKSIKDAITVGALGTILYCLLTNGLRGMVGWTLGNIIIALIVGLCCKFRHQCKNKFLGMFIVYIGIVVGCFLGIVILKSFIEWLLFLEPMMLRMMKNSYAFIADALVMIVGMIVYNNRLKDVHKKLISLCGGYPSME